MQQGGVKKETTDGGGGDAGEYGTGLRGIQGTYQKCVGIYISGESADCKQRRLEGSGRKPREGEEELGTVVSGAR